VLRSEIILFLRVNWGTIICKRAAELYFIILRSLILYRPTKYQELRLTSYCSYCINAKVAWYLSIRSMSVDSIIMTFFCHNSCCLSYVRSLASSPFSKRECPSVQDTLVLWH